ncbi:MAG: CopD family protein [Crocinitomicaceae bacterium]
MIYLWLKSLHLIFMVSWFAGILYMVRLFIYHAEAQSKPVNEKQILTSQFRIMEKRLWYIISWPAMVLTTVFGVWMLIENPVLLEQGFMHIKLTLVFGLIVYHLGLHQIFLKLQKDERNYKSERLRILNEVGTMFLVAIIFVIIMKNSFDWIYGLIGFFGLGILLMILIKAYKKYRHTHEK